MINVKTKRALAVACALILGIFSLFSCEQAQTDGITAAITTTAEGQSPSIPQPPTQNDFPAAPPSTSASTQTTEQDISEMDFSFSDRDKNSSYNPTAEIILSDSGSKVSGKGASADGSSVVITDEGAYYISGSVTNASITVSAEKTDKLQLIFDGVSVTNQNGAALYIKSADKVFLTLAENTENYLADGDSYTQTDGDTNIDAALYSKEDLTINGSGTLTVNGNAKHAIASSDDLVIVDCTLAVNAKNVGLKGKDCVKITNANITVTAGTDAIRSDNEDDTTRGYVYIENGTLALTAENDGIQAHTALRIDGGILNITTGGGSKNASVSTSGGFNPFWGGWGGGSTASADTPSAKALKSNGYIIINGGLVTVDSSDDSIHANGNVQINSGTLILTSGDDGIHADTLCEINGGDIEITKSYEGIEGSEIVINNGNISIVATDDGLNAAGGNDSSSLGARPGMGGFTSLVGSIEINGGYLLIDASGDGIDSNNTLTVSGGITLVSGPTNQGNSAFDHDGSAHVSGGILVALGTSSMAQSFNTAENQGAILVSFSTKTAGTSISVCDGEGRVIVSFTPSKAYNSAVVTTPEIQSGKTYTFYSGATVDGADENGFATSATQSGGTQLFSVEMTSLLYGGGMGGFGGGGFGGGGKPR